ncbi:hypothetical protein NDU88_007380 [Pleurodeles waltl]|uniref:Uncharacterized protein n=1 Tax=Pleurodeles waltl TaxID=8319 RepID=A0AAV7RSX0_PLEWA|nr:hypothetical protein NDU88_007380 [Pleurodeles waltl]
MVRRRATGAICAQNGGQLVIAAVPAARVAWSRTWSEAAREQRLEDPQRGKERGVLPKGIESERDEEKLPGQLIRRTNGLRCFNARLPQVALSVVGWQTIDLRILVTNLLRCCPAV